MKKYKAQNHRICICRCDCGGEHETLYTNLINKRPIKSCGCTPNPGAVKHGLSSSPEHAVWMSMLKRCRNPRSTSYHNYGGRGISVCKEWSDKKTGFQTFLRDMGKRPTEKHQIDRRENDGNYKPGNCRWVVSAINNRNRRNTVNLTLDGETMCLSEWARHLGMGVTTLYQRLKSGWSVEKALTTPGR
jgi:hypothetical protein